MAWSRTGNVPFISFHVKIDSPLQLQYLEHPICLLPGDLKAVSGPEVGRYELQAYGAFIKTLLSYNIRLHLFRPQIQAPT